MRLAVNKVHALISLASHADLTNHTVDHFQYHEQPLTTGSLDYRPKLVTPHENKILMQCNMDSRQSTPKLVYI